MLTEDEVKSALPPSLRSSVTPSLMSILKEIEADPDSVESIRENFLTYSHVLKEGKYKTEDYINAVRYVSFKNMGLSNQDSYMKTFPTRYQALLARGATLKDISAYVSAYHKGKLVNKIMEQAMIPVHVLFQDVFHQAILKQAHLMNSAASELVQTQAANSLLTHLAKPKELAAKLSIEVGESNALTELSAAMTKMAGMQQEMIRQGVSTKKVAAMDIVDAEVKNAS